MTSYENLSYFNSRQDDVIIDSRSGSYSRWTPDFNSRQDDMSRWRRDDIIDLRSGTHSRWTPDVFTGHSTFGSFAAAQRLTNNIEVVHSFSGHDAYIAARHALAGHDGYRINRYSDQANSEQFRAILDNSMNYSRTHRYTDFLRNGRNTTDFLVSNGPNSVVLRHIHTGNLYNVGRDFFRSSQNLNQENNLRQEDNLNQDNNLNEEVTLNEESNIDEESNIEEESNIVNEEATLNEESNIDEEVIGTVRKRKRIS